MTNPTPADLAAFGASEAACYLYPDADQQSLRAAYCAGAASMVITPTSADVIKGMRWRPIESAPKDGTRILLADARTVVTGYWGVTRRAGVVTGADWQCDWQAGESGDRPTDWMPLPPPPKPDNQGGA